MLWQRWEQDCRQPTRSRETPSGHGCSFSSYSSARGLAVGFTTPPPLLQPAQAAVAGIPLPALVAAAGILPQVFVLVWEGHPHPPPPVACFDGLPTYLVHFLAQAWHHMECYGVMYPDDMAWSMSLRSIWKTALWSGWCPCIMKMPQR